MRQLIGVTAFLLCISALPPVQAGQDQARARQGPRNLKVLPPTTDMRKEMEKISKALGVECGFCHVQGNFASDENQYKRTARKMMLMVKAINETNFPDQQSNEPLGSPVTCYTCHRGEEHPATAPATEKPGRR